MAEKKTGGKEMKIDAIIRIDLSHFMCYAEQGSQGYNIIITPRLGHITLNKQTAEIIAEALNKIFTEESEK